MNTNCAIDLVSSERLQRIRELAEKATPGPWKAVGEFTCQVVTDYAPQKERAGGYGSGNNFVCFLNDGENGVYNDEEEQNNTATFIAAAHPGVILAMCEEIERLREQVATQEVLSGEDDACMTQLEVERDALEEQVARLEKEADWLAARCREFCDSNNYCNECALYPGDADFPHPDCGQKIDVENARWRFEKRVVSDWREAARKAVEGI